MLSAACAVRSSAAGAASAQDCMIGEVKVFAGSLPPVNEALAEGQLLPISQEQVAAGGGATVTGRAPISNTQPSTGLDFSICVDGLYPSQQ